MQQQPVIERMSVHAASRQRQRGVSDLQLELLTRYGALSRQKGGSKLCTISGRELARLRRALDGLDGLGLVISEENTCITVERLTSSVRRLTRDTHLRPRRHLR
ncbi:MAG: hypothetical protein HUK26_09070 [Duodenibacillus sp.]|nr:hypothetical protein [Duodenibacillus sp.]